MNELRRTADGGWEFRVDDEWKPVSMDEVWQLFPDLTADSQAFVMDQLKGIESIRPGGPISSIPQPVFQPELGTVMDQSMESMRPGGPISSIPQPGFGAATEGFAWPWWAGPYPPKKIDELGRETGVDLEYVRKVQEQLLQENRNAREAAYQNQQADYRAKQDQLTRDWQVRQADYRAGQDLYNRDRNAQLDEFARYRFALEHQPRPYHPSVEQQIADALYRGDEAEAIRLQEFSQRPSGMDMFNTAMRIAQSPVDSLTLAAMQRGELPIQGTPGSFERIGPINPFLQASLDRLMSQYQQPVSVITPQPIISPPMGPSERELSGVNEFPAFPRPETFYDFPVENTGFGPLGGIPRRARPR